MTATAAELIEEIKHSLHEDLAFHCLEKLNSFWVLRHVTEVSANQADDKYKKSQSTSLKLAVET